MLVLPSFVAASIYTRYNDTDTRAVPGFLLERVNNSDGKPCGLYYQLPPCNISHLESVCDSTMGCSGFNSDGWLKGCLSAACGAPPYGVANVDLYISHGGVPSFKPLPQLPRLEDQHYTYKEPMERKQAMQMIPSLQSVQAIQNDTGFATVVCAGSGTSQQAEVGDPVCGGFILRSIIYQDAWDTTGAPSTPASSAVLEQSFRKWSLLVRVGTGGRVSALRTGVGMPSELEQPRYDFDSIDPDYFFTV